jgi:hypothetical protein
MSYKKHELEGPLAVSPPTTTTVEESIGVQECRNIPSWRLADVSVVPAIGSHSSPFGSMTGSPTPLYEMPPRIKTFPFDKSVEVCRDLL